MNNIKNTVDVRFLVTTGVLISALFLVSAVPVKINRPIVVRKIDVVGKKAFTNINLEALSAVVYDVRNDKIIFAKDANAVRPLASVTKLMTALTASKLLEKNSLVQITTKDLMAQGDSGLRPGEKFSFQKLVDFVLTSSSNDGSTAIASVAGARMTTGVKFHEDMNNLARSIGLKGLLFENPTGLDSNMTSSGAYGTAEDVAKLLAYIVKTNPGLISGTRYEYLNVNSENKISHTAKNTNEALPSIPGLIGGKTGFTDLSNGNLVIAFDAGLSNPFVVVVLGSSEKGRFEDVKKLVSATLLSLEPVPSKVE